MKRICRISVLGLLAFAPLLRAQDTPLPVPDAANTNSAAAVASRQEAEENYNTLKGHVEDLLAAQADQAKQIQALKKDLDDLRLQLTRPSGNYASQDDLKALNDAIQELDKKREADKKLILEEIKGAVEPTTPHPTSHPPAASPNAGGGAVNSDQNGFYYTIKKDDTLGLIAQAYREQGVKVTTKQIEDANPNLNPAKLHVGVKIFIPAPKGASGK